jgi:ribosome-associated protein
MIQLTPTIALPKEEIEINAIRSQGAGGQNVNKVASAIHLRLNIHASSLPVQIKRRLLQLPDRRISREGVIVIKAQRYRDQEKNRQDALQRLKSILNQAANSNKKRILTRPPKASIRRRLDAKNRRGQQKALRRKVLD